jgi:hypothetical protein
MVIDGTNPTLVGTLHIYTRDMPAPFLIQIWMVPARAAT